MQLLHHKWWVICMEDTLLKSYHISKVLPSTVQQPKSHVHLGIRQERVLPGIAGEYLMIISPILWKTSLLSLTLSQIQLSLYFLSTTTVQVFWGLSYRIYLIIVRGYRKMLAILQYNILLITLICLSNAYAKKKTYCILDKPKVIFS